MIDQRVATVQQSAVTPWASRADVRELGNRIKEMMPGGNRLQPHEALALAQAALAHNLDPFNGELWFIPGRGLMAGIKGHRRAAHAQLDHEGGGNYWPEFIGPLSIDDLTALHIPENALAFKCRLFDSRNIETYTNSIERMLRAGMPWEVVSSVMGKRPYTEGIGYWTPGENTKMTPVQCAQKRAEADALKRRFDLPFTMAVGANGDQDEILPGEFTVQASESPAEIQEQIQERRQAAAASLYGDGEGLGPKWEADPQPSIAPAPKVSAQAGKRFWSGETVQLVIKSGVAATGPEAAALLGKSGLSSRDPEDVLMRWIGKYKAALGDGQPSELAIRAADETLPQAGQ